MISQSGDWLALPFAACWKVTAMFRSLDSRRAIWSTVVVVGSLFMLSGCKHVYRGSGVESSVSGSCMQPYDGEPVLDTPALHDPLPELSPVPPLPGAGHSVPPEPLPPPAPAEPTSAQSESGKQPVLQPQSFWSQLSARASTGRSTSVSQFPKVRQGRHAAFASSTASARIMDSRLAASALGVSTSTTRANSTDSKLDETTTQGFYSLGNLAGENNNPPIESVSSSAVRGGLAFPVPRSTLAEVEAKGVVITPLPQPFTMRSGVIEDWPYRSQPTGIAAESRKIVSPQPASEVPTTPSNETQFGLTEPAQAEMTVPSLLPPGP